MTIKTSKDSLKARLGSDLTFPIANNFVPISGMDLLLQDIQLLLLTLPGERVNRPNFGCNLRASLWENIEQAAAQGAKSIKVAITRFEPRVKLKDVTSVINRNTGLITFTISFTVIDTDVAVNLVFPYRINTQLSFQ